MAKEKIVAMLLIGFAALGILYYLGKKASRDRSRTSSPRPRP